MATTVAAPPSPAVAVGRTWGEPLTCAVLTLVCCNRTLRRLSVSVTEWGVAIRGMVWALLAFALLAYVTIGTGTALAEFLAPSLAFAPPWALAFALEAVAIVLISGIGGVALAHVFRSPVRRAGGAGPIRGAHVFDGGRWQVNTEKARAKIQREGRLHSAVRFAGCGIAFEDETKHFLALGATGRASPRRSGSCWPTRRAEVIGRSSPTPMGAIRPVLRSGARRHHLEPADARSARWSPIEDAPTAYLAEELARALIPDLSQSDSQWTSYARTLLASILRQARPAGLTDAAEIHQLIVSAPLEELRMLLAGTAAAPFLAEGSEKQFAGTRSTGLVRSVMRLVKGLAYLIARPAVWWGDHAASLSV